ncbi:MAG: WD40/YVTN/BNR-like repeat-containing protein [Vicinamibacterales bacterium]
MRIDFLFAVGATVAVVLSETAPVKHPGLAAASVPLAQQPAGATEPTGPAWVAQSSGTTVRLRGVSAASRHVVWASGEKGTVLRTSDGGASWAALQVPDAGSLDFRDIDSVTDRTAYVLSIGTGGLSRIYKTTDAGRSWALQFVNADPEAFFDAMAFSDGETGYAFSDSVDGRFVVLRTTDGGVSWMRLPPAALPPAVAGEGAYAASGTNIAVGGRNVWIGTTASRVLRSNDGGRTWQVSPTPLAHGPSAGIFSVAFKDGSNGVVVGGDYRKEGEALDNLAFSTDGGGTWRLAAGLTGFRSAVAYVPASPTTILAVGPSGTDYSTDSGGTWRSVPGPGFHALSFAPGTSTAWAVGEKGSISRIDLEGVR